MTKEQVLALFPEGTVSDEALEEIMKLKGLAVNKAVAGVKPAVDEAELKRLQEAAAAYEKLQEEGLPESEQLKKLIADTEKAKADFTKKANRLEAEKILLAAGVKLEESESLIEGIISEDLERTTTLASSLAKLLADQKEAVERATKQKLMDDTKTSGGGKGSSGKDSDLTEAEKIAGEIAERMTSSKKSTEAIMEKFV